MTRNRTGLKTGHYKLLNQVAARLIGSREKSRRDAGGTQEGRKGCITCARRICHLLKEVASGEWRVPRPNRSSRPLRFIASGRLVIRRWGVAQKEIPMALITSEYGNAHRGILKFEALKH